MDRAKKYPMGVKMKVRTLNLYTCLRCKKEKEAKEFSLLGFEKGLCRQCESILKLSKENND